MKQEFKAMTNQELMSYELKLANEVSAVKLEILHRWGYRRGIISLKEQRHFEINYTGFIMDHGFSLNNKKEGTRIIIGEPYDICDCDLKKLADDPKFIRITADSLHFPGKTLAIHFRGNK